MSRIGKKPINIPNGVTVTVNDKNDVTVKGPKGELHNSFNQKLSILVEDNIINIERPNDNKESRMIHGTTRALINNMVVGVNEGYKKELEIIGVGYRAQLKGNTLVLSAGYSHPVEMVVPDGIEVEVPKNTQLVVKGIDKQLVGEFSANIRSVRAPEPYKGKGIRYKGEYVRRKEGKTAGK